jgi:ABC-type glycerol-3-phosphate transport system permease component
LSFREDKLFEFNYFYIQGAIMKTTATGTVSGCIVWIIVFGLLSLCLFPISMMIGGFTSVSDFAMQTVAPLICPDGTTVESYSYATTTTDEFGNTQPSTAYELHCIDATGTAVKEDPVLYAFLWMGIIAAIGLVISALLAFALAAPAGVLIARVLDRNKKTNLSANIEPE